MIMNYKNIVKIYGTAGEMFAIPGVIKPGANIDVLRRGMPIFRQRSVTGARGARMDFQEVNTLGPDGHRQTRLIVKHTPPRTRP